CVYSEVVIVVLDPQTRTPAPISPGLRTQLEQQQPAYL
ncbi:MAG: acyl-CoA thioesterase, partial [Corynebacterium sp.]|nr:acyl-CoA thioesterase [Corynebacterium sp.]